jgi:hypothetical protein
MGKNAQTELFQRHKRGEKMPENLEDLLSSMNNKK